MNPEYREALFALLLASLLTILVLYLGLQMRTQSSLLVERHLSSIIERRSKAEKQRLLV